MNRMTVWLFCLVWALLPQATFAVITFQQLDDNMFIVNHRVKGLGSRGQAMRLVYEKAASLCVAAGYSFFRIVEEESTAGQQYDAANASVRVQFFWDDSEQRIDCERNATPGYVQEAREGLAEEGYAWPQRPAAAPDATPSSTEGTLGSSCTLEQIAAMARAGLSDEQIRAACP